MSEEEIRKYMEDKSIVVYATESFIDEDSDALNKTLVSYLVPIARKRLDYRYHKNVGAQIEEYKFEIQNEFF